VTCYATTLALLAAFTASRRDAGAVHAVSSHVAFGLPLAAALGAVHRDEAIFATSGLETSLFTLLALGGYLLVLDAPGRPRRAAAAGLVLALAALTRPDGVLFAAVGGIYLLAVSPRRARDLAAFAAPLVLLLGAYAAWK